MKRLTLNQAKQIFIQDGIHYSLDVAFDTGFQNDFDNRGNPEKWCVLKMKIDEAREYVVVNTDWFIKEEDGQHYLVGENQIGGFGFAKEKINRTKELEEILSDTQTDS